MHLFKTFFLKLNSYNSYLVIKSGVNSDSIKVGTKASHPLNLHFKKKKVGKKCQFIVNWELIKKIPEVEKDYLRSIKETITK